MAITLSPPKVDVAIVKVWTWALMPFVIAALVLKFGFIPIEKKRDQSYKHLRKVVSEFESSKDRAAELTKLKAQLAQLALDADNYKLSLLRSNERNELLNQLKQRAAAASLAFVNTDPMPAADRGFCSALPINVNFSAGFPSAVSYLRAIEKLPGLMKISGLKITAENPPEGPKAQSVSVTATLEFLIAKEDLAARTGEFGGTPDAPLAQPYVEDVFSDRQVRKSTREAVDISQQNRITTMGLSCCLTGAPRPAAVIDGRLVSVGDDLDGYTIVRIEQNRVILTDSRGVEHLLDMKEASK